MTKILTLIRKDIQSEYREKYAISGIFLYVVVLVFVIFLSVREMEPQTWIALFWLMMVFFSLDVCMHGSLRESAARHWYYYSIIHPYEILLAKIIYNFVLLILIGLLCFAGMALIAPVPIQNANLFFLTGLLGIFGLTVTLTSVSQVSSLAGKSATLTTILGFPVLLPVLLQTIQLSISSTLESTGSFPSSDLSLLCGVDLLVFGVSLSLFPYLWRR